MGSAQSRDRAAVELGREAQGRGERFMGYGEARARFRAVLAAAASERPVGDVLREVFDLD